MLKIIETPRDAMQGIKEFIPTKKKIAYINALLKVGFDTIDFGSFVSPKAIPQLRDTAQVVEGLDLSDTKTKLLAIIPNLKGAQIAESFDQINYLGYPFSISNTFLQLNINSDIGKSFDETEKILNLSHKSGKELVVYVSMAFGNPYGDLWSPEIVYEWTRRLHQIGVKIIALSDTTGVGNPDTIGDSFRAVINEFPEIEFGAHLHTHPENCTENIKAAFDSGCRRFDTVINGLGGCPMSKQKMIGNLKTRNLLQFLKEHNIDHGLNLRAFHNARALEAFTFPSGLSIPKS
ncbi:MAG: hydroxymethylglutaryl-CoA lyase [Bacteroidales bacterium]|jgi:hydroxymethylglutaryl-CoA lyase|nr:hydroxymethylglutaryl-CoA lyase [Bacteroidales bacterium]